MAGHPPLLDREALTRLRQLVAALKEAEGTYIPFERLVLLANQVDHQAGITVDFEATRVLGEAMVVIRVAHPEAPAACLESLSRREREVASLIAEGLSNKEIARRLHLSVATVKDHVHRILSRTGLPNRAAIASAQRGYQPTS